MKYLELPRCPSLVASAVFPDNHALLYSFLMQPKYGMGVFEPKEFWKTDSKC